MLASQGFHASFNCLQNETTQIKSNVVLHLSIVDVSQIVLDYVDLFQEKKEFDRLVNHQADTLVKHSFGWRSFGDAEEEKKWFGAWMLVYNSGFITLCFSPMFFCKKPQYTSNWEFDPNERVENKLWDLFATNRFESMIFHLCSQIRLNSKIHFKDRTLSDQRYLDTLKKQTFCNQVKVQFQKIFHVGGSNALSTMSSSN